MFDNMNLNMKDNILSINQCRKTSPGLTYIPENLCKAAVLSALPLRHTLRLKRSYGLNNELLPKTFMS